MVNWRKYSKSYQVATVCVVLFVCYTYLFSTGARDNDFLITGGFLGLIGSIIVVTDCIIRRDSRGNWPPQISLLFWRAFCDLGLSTRFLLQPALNIYICGHLNCTRESGDASRCSWPSFVLEFFIVASELWFLCNGLDLYYSITNPFFSYGKRVMYYHACCWSAALFIAASPFMLNSWKEIYGFWYVNPHVDDSAICWIKITWNNYAWPIWVYFFCPLLLIYIICLFSLLVAYLRLRRGITKSFLPRMRLLITNAANLTVHMLYWTVFVIIYLYTFWTRSQYRGNEPANNILAFVMASKGISALLVWILTSRDKDKFRRIEVEDTNKEATERLDANKALREEVLSFATAGIRSSARAGSKVTADSRQITRKPQHHDSGSSEAFKELVNPMFFLRFLLGQNDEVKALEFLVSSKRRSVNEDFMRQTVTTAAMPSELGHGGGVRRSSGVGMFASAGGAAGGAAGSNRFSQRATVVSGAESVSQASSQDSGFGQDSTAAPPTSFLIRLLGMGGGPSASRRGSVTSSSSSQRPSEGGLELDNLGDKSGNNFNRDSDVESRSSSMIETNVVRRAENKRKKPIHLHDTAVSCKNSLLRGFYQMAVIDSTESVEFTEYEPFHFRRVRMSCGITDALYSTYFSTTIKERLTQGGASGAFFFFSKGEKFIAKSCSASELETLKQNAEAYANHLCTYTDSTISKIFGAYRLQIYGNSLYFFVMNNIFLNSEQLAINEKYDIKGSWVARNATPPINDMTVTCSHCEQKYTFSTTKKRKNKKRLGNPNSRNVSAEKTQMLSNLADLGILDDSSNQETMNPMGGSDSGTNSRTSSLNHYSTTAIMRSMLPRSNDTTDTEDTLNQSEMSPLICPYTVDGEHAPNVILKDNDIKYKIRLSRPITEGLLEQLRRDAEFLCRIGVMDYSLLVGVHNTEYEVYADNDAALNSTNMLVKSSNSFSSLPQSKKPFASSPKDAAAAAAAAAGGGGRGSSGSSGSDRPSAVSNMSTPSIGGGGGGGENRSSNSSRRSSRPSIVQPDLDGERLSVAISKPPAKLTPLDFMPAVAEGQQHQQQHPPVSINSAAERYLQQAGLTTPASAVSADFGANPRLSRVALPELSFASQSVGHSEDSEGLGDLGFARKLDVYRVIGPDAYFMGIIDFQQKWTLKKQMERFIKVNIYGYDADGLSAIEPEQYRDRFLKKMEDILDSESLQQQHSRIFSGETQV